MRIGARVLLTLYTLASPAWAQQQVVDEVQAIRAAGEAWVEGIGRGDPDYMVSLYAEDAILHGTISPVLRNTPELIREYFQGTAANPPTMAFVEPRSIHYDGGNMAASSGFYTTRFGTNEPVTLRYTFVYRLIDGRWLIVEHHSSRLP